jgi:hypothetical protein
VEQKANQKIEPEAKSEMKGKPFVFTEAMKQTIAGLGPTNIEDAWEGRVAKICGLDPDSSKVSTALATALDMGLWKSGMAVRKTGEEDLVFAGKEWWDKRESKELEQDRQEAELRKTAEEKNRSDQLEAEKRESDRLKAERDEKLKLEAEKLKDLPPNTGMVELADFIQSHCELSLYAWPEIFQFARENGFIVFDSGISGGVNSQPITSADASL